MLTRRALAIMAASAAGKAAFEAADFGAAPKAASINAPSFNGRKPASQAGNARIVTGRGDQHAALVQQAETMGLNPVQSRFESGEPHHLPR